MRTILLILIFAAQDADIDALVRALGAESIVERDAAETKLAAMGAAAIPRLRLALDAADPEVRSRARSIVAEFDRLDEERRYDAAWRERIVNTMREPAASGPDWVKIGGFKVYFTLDARRVLTTSAAILDYMALDFDVAVESEAGAEMAVERCGKCSPTAVLVKGGGPVRPRVKGLFRWWSAYDVIFDQPRQGDRKRVGPYTFEVQWPCIIVRAPEPTDVNRLYQVCHAFAFERKPGVAKAEDEETVVRFGGRSSGRPKVQRAGWCACEKGPQPPIKRPDPVLARERRLEHGEASLYKLDDIGKITLKVLKPHEEPVDVRGPLLTPP